MILWALIYLSLNFSFALPTTPSDTPIDISPSLFTRTADTFGSRSIWNIIWSCFSTIFACSWIAVHPNIPAPKESKWAVFWRRVAIMGYVLIAPEIVITWASRQHSAAKSLAKQHQGRGWTMTHGFFIGMGGFTLHDQRGTALRILEPNELEKLSEAGRIQWPSITEEEIQDKSKGDYLSKAIVLVQTTWFVTQCIVRGAYRLEVTELEVATLAFAAMTGVMYYLWWNKPLDVRCSVPVYLLKDREKDNDLNSNHVEYEGPVSEGTQIAPKSTHMERLSSFIQQQRQRRGTVLGLAYVFLIYPLLIFFTGLGDPWVSDKLDASMPLRVPTFYSPGIKRTSVLGGIIVAVIFGSIHCIAWSFHFPSLQERLLWRISAVSVTGLPVLCIAAAYLIKRLESIEVGSWSPSLDGGLFRSMMMALFVLYIIARIILLILPCIALRALRPTALVEIHYASFFPHIA